MTKTLKAKAEKLKDYFACVTVEVQIYVRAKDAEHASDLVEAVMDSIRIDSSVDCESIDYDGHEISEVSLHE